MKIILFLGLLYLIFPEPAYAYLDPGTGSYIFQILIAGVLGSLFFLKSIIRKVKSFFSRFLKKRSNIDS